MRSSIHLLARIAQLCLVALAVASGTDLAPRVEDATDGLEEWLAAAKRVSPETVRPCPVPCSAANKDWFLIPDAKRLALCNETMLLNMFLKSSDGDETQQTIVRACSADSNSETQVAFIADARKASLCTTSNRVLANSSIYIHQPQVANNNEFHPEHLAEAGRQMPRHLGSKEPSCTHNAIEIAYSQSSIMGLFAGAELHQQGITMDILSKLMDYIRDREISKTTVLQLCGANGRGADYNFGIVFTNSKNLALVRDSIKTWSDGACVSNAREGEDWMRVILRIPVPVDDNSKNNTNETSAGNDTTSAHGRGTLRQGIRVDCRTSIVQPGDVCWAVAKRCGISQSDLEKYNRNNLCNTLVKGENVCCSSGSLPSTLPGGNADGTCKTRSVISGDDCGSLASKCGISAADFMKVNTKSELCSTLAEGQQVCCSSGKMPDLKPKPDANGNCAAYTTKKDDSCSKIAASRDLSVADLENFNKKTWGWNGCKLLYPDYKMCVSTGSPPMPANVPNAVCGPTMNGTVQPPAGTDLATLNPCPLNVCCNIWGQCGMTDDFCVISKSESGAPGTSAPGKNGCISNCGRDIIKSSPPRNKIKVAYYESWNFARQCLTMHVDEIDTSEYTHIHFAFANVTRGDFKVELTDPSVKEQFEIFKRMKNIKKIVSLGGWAFSTEPGSFSVLREAVLPANREKFKNNLISFMNDHDLDGIDLDWEYPGAPDIPGIPSDDPVNGLNYYKLLSSLKSSVGSSKSVSFAAPASYWYLKSFPIKNMAKDLDYIIYMTYDLHGQWDYGNKWTTPGCESGNCLRSHVNETETKDALSMITKAGAASNKVVVGVASYGRSFKMAQAGCDSEQCQFTGSPRQSNAAQGRCTKTAGYISNAEIDEIIVSGKINKQWTKEGSNIMVCNDTEWVAWMNDDMKKKRSQFYDSYNFAGTTDWAVDLQEFTDGSGSEEEGEGYIDFNYWPTCRGSYGTLEDLEHAKGTIPVHCVNKYLLDVQINVLEGALSKYKDLVEKGYDKKFEIYEKYVEAQIPEQINNFMATSKVDKYFKCQETKDITCCSSCQWVTCMETCVSGPNCKNGRGTVDMDKCPKMEFEDKGLGPGTVIPNATFILKNSKGFYDDLAETWGIEESWITFDRRHMKTNNGCQYDENVNECRDRNDNWFYDYPRTNDFQIYNPKKVIGNSYPKATEMLGRFKILRNVGAFDEFTQMSDLVDATSLPAFSTQEAVESMNKIVEKADEMEKKEREELILNFITGLLFFIPVGGEIAGAAGLTAARNLLRLIGAVGDAGMTIHDLIKDPKNAFMTVFSYLASAGVGRGGFKDAANARRGMSSKEYNSLGNVKVRLDTVTSIRGNMCKA